MCMLVQILSLCEELQSSHREREVLMSQLHAQLSDREEQVVEARAGQAAAEVEVRDKANEVAKQAVSCELSYHCCGLFLSVCVIHLRFTFG